MQLGQPPAQADVGIDEVRFLPLDDGSEAETLEIDAGGNLGIDGNHGVQLSPVHDIGLVVAAETAVAV